MRKYICKHCGAHLDPGEHCDCSEIEELTNKMWINQHDNGQFDISDDPHPIEEEQKLKVYIAGPITGLFDYKKEFKKVEKKIVAMGHIVLNPSFLPSGLSNYMPICKAMID